jgi:Na+-driven multidrug efflux pump
MDLIDKKPNLLWNMLAIAIPSILNYFFLFLIVAINLIFIGSRGDPYKIAGVGIANTIVAMFVVGPIQGIVIS